MTVTASMLTNHVSFTCIRGKTKFLVLLCSSESNGSSVTITGLTLNTPARLGHCLFSSTAPRNSKFWRQYPHPLDPPF